MYKNITFIFVLVIAFSFLSSQSFAQDGKNFGFVGTKTCGMCHKKDADGAQLKIWEGSAHANAFKTLQTAEADAVAKKLGHETKAAETKDCLKCHATGYDADASLIGKKFDVADGVQCESCHGAGEKYKSKKIMEDKQKSIENGMVAYANEEAIKAQCLTCHNDKSPTYKEFDFAKRWAEIKHDIPEKK